MLPFGYDLEVFARPKGGNRKSPSHFVTLNVHSSLAEYDFQF